ncbi:hypothetical protein VPH35_001919 [Triticum aestivum]
MIVAFLPMNLVLFFCWNMVVGADDASSQSWTMKAMLRPSLADATTFNGGSYKQRWRDGKPMTMESICWDGGGRWWQSCNSALVVESVPPTTMGRSGAATATSGAPAQAN